MPDEDEWTHGEIARALTRIEGDLKALGTKVDGLAVGFVSRGEWVVWSETRDREIKSLKDARAPWWSVVPIIISVVSVLVAIVVAIASYTR